VDWLIFVGVLALWWVVQAWLLPRLGVPTWAVPHPRRSAGTDNHVARDDSGSPPRSHWSSGSWTRRCSAGDCVRGRDAQGGGL